MIEKSKKNGILTDEENQFFKALQKRTEEMDQFFARLVKNAGIKKKK